MHAGHGHVPRRPRAGPRPRSFPLASRDVCRHHVAMYLKTLKIKNFRSFWSDDAKPTVDIELAPGVNYFAGANNVGKSNLLRALALALDTKAYRTRRRSTGRRTSAWTPSPR